MPDTKGEGGEHGSGERQERFVSYLCFDRDEWWTGRSEEQGVIKQPDEFVAFEACFSMELWFLWRGKKKISFRDVKEVSDRAVITACQIAPAQEMIWNPPPFFFTERFETKDPPHTPPHSLICLGGALLGGGSAWTERALPEDYRMRGGGDMCDCERVYICVGGVSNFFSPQNAAIVSKIEQCRALTLIFQPIHYLLCSYLCLNEKKKPQQC